MRTTKKKKSERNREGGFEREEESYFERSVTSRSNSKRLLEESSRSGEVKVMTRQINTHTVFFKLNCTTGVARKSVKLAIDKKCKRHRR